MNRVLVTVGIIFLVGLGAYLGSVGAAGAAKEERAQPGAGLTVYLDASARTRKHGGAERMTELHEEHFEKGWQVVDMEPYLENNDLQGFFITYVGRD